MNHGIVVGTPSVRKLVIMAARRSGVSNRCGAAFAQMIELLRHKDDSCIRVVGLVERATIEFASGPRGPHLSQAGVRQCRGGCDRRHHRFRGFAIAVGIYADFI